MGQTLEALLKLQSVETQLSQVRSRLRSRQNAVRAQQRKIDQLRQEVDEHHERLMNKRRRADELDLDLKQKEEHVAKLRTSLNAAKTNKEYAAILTEINTFRADNSKVEEEALRIMQEADAVKAEGDQIQSAMALEETILQEVTDTSQSEIERLEAILADLQAKRNEAEADVPKSGLAIFNRMAERYDGEAMAVIDAQGKKAPTYTCGGCFMSITAEHVNALQVVDEIRTCDNCGRILYLDPAEQKTKT